MKAIMSLDEARAIHTASAAAVIAALPDPSEAIVRSHLVGTVRYADIPREARPAVADHFAYLEMIESAGHGWIIADELEGVLSAVAADPSVVIHCADQLDYQLPAIEAVNLAAA